MTTTFTPWPDTEATHYRNAGYWTGETFGALLDRLAAQHPDRTAVIAGDTRLSYRRLRDRARGAAAGLAARGLERGDVVVTQSDNSAEYLIVLFALFMLGVVPVCALPAHRRAEIGHFCRITAAAGYLHPDTAEHADVAAAVSDDVPWHLTLNEVAAAPPHPGPAPEEPRADEVALLQLSGGSTGIGKLIPRTHDDYLYSVRIAAQVCQLDTDTVYLCVLPVAHNFPLSSPGVLGVLYAGGTVVMAPDPSPDTGFRLIAAEGVTMTAVVPAIAGIWLRAAEARRPELPTLETFQVGGARMDAEQAQRVTPLLGARLQQVFGMAEGLVCYTRHDDPPEVVHHTQGTPASPADEVLIVDDADRPVPDGVDGHLLTRGPYTIRGYYRADAHNATAFTTDGYYRTGDIVRRTPGGQLVVTGRAKDQVNRGGEKIAAAEIEERLRAHPDIADVALVAVPDDVLGERGCAFCVTTAPVTGAALRSFLRDQGVAAYKIPDLVRFVTALPRTPIGKTDKQQLKETLTR